jgi:hypothetical protein
MSFEKKCIKEDLLQAYSVYRRKWFFKRKAKDYLEKTIKEVNEFLEDANYDDWIELKRCLDPIEEHLYGKQTDHSLMSQFSFCLQWYGPNHWRTQVYFEQYKDRTSFIILQRTQIIA